MPTITTWFLMLLPPAGQVGQPVYVQPFADPVACQVRVIELREAEPAKKYECRALKGAVDLSRPAAKGKP